MSPIEFYTAEANRIHDLMDAADVPRTASGELLSLSQRVEFLLVTHAMARTAIVTMLGSPGRPAT